jgi:Ca2+/Na+ antiporter
MAKIDRLKEEAIELRTSMFFILGAILMLLGGIGSLYLKFITYNSPLIVIGILIILTLLPFLAIIYFSYKKKYYKKLKEIEKE